VRPMPFAVALAVCLDASLGWAEDLSGTWIGNVTCNGQYLEPQPWPLTLNVTSSGGRYTLTASTPNSSGEGTIEFNVVIFKQTGLFGLNQSTFTGTVAGNRMDGLYRQSTTARPCTWSVIRDRSKRP
jgi:hypothetical protein